MSEESIPAVNGSDGNTSATTSPSSEGKVPLIGHPGPWFATIHISALTSITISTLVSASLIMYLSGCTCRRKPSTVKPIKEHCGSGRHTGDGTSGDSHSQTAEVSCHSSLGSVTSRGKPAPRNMQHIRYFWKWNVGERFVLYLAACDVGFGISHSLDHIHIYHFVDHPPDLLCAFYGFLLHQFSVGQWFVVATCAVSACSLVVFGKKISLGRWDWRLFAFAFVFPLVVGIFGIVYRMLGASGAWCYVNIGTVAGLRYYMVFTIFQIVLYGVVAVAYAAIWFKIRRTTELLEESSTNRYQNSARMMLIFVAVFIFQWWSMTLHNLWVLIGKEQPPPIILVIAVILVNFGGVYNCFAYTIIRRRLQKQAKNSGAKVVVVTDGRKPKHRALDRVQKTPVEPSIPMDERLQPQKTPTVAIVTTAETTYM